MADQGRLAEERGQVGAFFGIASVERRQRVQAGVGHGAGARMIEWHVTRERPGPHRKGQPRRSSRRRWGALGRPDAACAREFPHRPLDRMPPELIRAIALIKWAAAETNGELGELPAPLASAIAAAALEVAAGRHADQFPLGVMQTGSGTSTNMNVNEVTARLASREARQAGSSERPRQSLPEQQRRHSDRHTPRGRARRARCAAAGACEARAGDRGQGRRGRRPGEGRAHASHGCAADHGRPGDARLAVAGRGFRDRASTPCVRDSTGSHSARPPSEPASTRIRNSRRARSRASRPARAST